MVVVCGGGAVAVSKELWPWWLLMRASDAANLMWGIKNDIALGEGPYPEGGRVKLVKSIEWRLRKVRGTVKCDCTG